MDINRTEMTLELGQILDIPHFKGKITQQIFDEIKLFEKTEENEGFFRTQQLGNVLCIEYLKSPFS